MRADAPSLVTETNKNGEILYARMDGPRLQRIVEAARKARANQTWPRALYTCFRVPYTMTAGKRLERYGEIGERAYNYVENWLLENAPELLENAPQVLTLQVSQERLAREAFGGNVNQASRALRAMVEAGVLSVVKPGYKGFSTLYAYLPLPGDEGAYGWEVSGSDA